jgi:hypothetical protein
MRNPARMSGVSGLLTAQYLGTSEQNGRTIVALSIADSVEGRLDVQLDLGAEVRAEEFLDYSAGDRVVAAVRTRRPSLGPPTASVNTRAKAANPSLFDVLSGRGGGLVPPSVYGADYGISANLTQSLKIQLGAGAADRTEDPLFSPAWIEADAMRIEKTTDPASVVRSTGPRRETALAKLSLDAARLNPDVALGREVTWTGRLETIRQNPTRCHLVFRLDNATIEAFAMGADFVTALDDYVTYDESHQRADTVTITATIVDPDTVPQRLLNSKPVLQLTSIERVDVPTSKASAGQPRDPATIDASRRVSAADQLFRQPPAVDSEVTFEAYYSSYSTTNKEVTLETGPDSNHRIVVKTDVSEGFFRTVRSDNDRLVVTGVVTSLGVGYQRDRLHVTASSLRKARPGRSQRSTKS